MAENEDRQREIDKIRRDRTDGMRLLRSTIEWVGSAPYAILNYYQIKQRLRHFNVQLVAARDNNTKLLQLTDNENDRTALVDEFAVLDNDCLDAMGSIEERMDTLMPARLADALQAQANDGNVAAAAAGPVPAVQQQQPVFQLALAFQPDQIQNTWGRFSGEVLDWYDWKAKFALAVHDLAADKMPVVNKLKFLLSALDPEASKTIAKFEPTAENYDQIWNELVNRYEKRYTMASAYLDKFFALPFLDNRATSKQLHEMVNTTNELIRRIKTVNYPIEQWNMIIVHALHKRLNAKHRKEWEDERKNNDDPTIDDMTKALLKMATSDENQGLVYKPLHVIVRNDRQNQPVAGQNRNRRDACNFCDSPAHQNALCPSYVSQPFHTRKQMVFTHRLCVYCLKHGHFLGECWTKKACGEHACGDEKHHATICPAKDKRNPYNFSETVAYAAPSSRQASSSRQAEVERVDRAVGGIRLPFDTRFPSGRGRGRGKRPGDNQI